MNFKSPNQRKYIFKVLSDKKKGIKTIDLKKPQDISFKQNKLVDPIPKIPKFTKIKKYFK